MTSSPSYCAIVSSSMQARMIRRRNRWRDSRSWPALPPARPGCFQWRPGVEVVLGDWLKESRQEPQKRAVERVLHRR
jgi:hypothetical protein